MKFGNPQHEALFGDQPSYCLTKEEVNQVFDEQGDTAGIILLFTGNSCNFGSSFPEPNVRAAILKYLRVDVHSSVNRYQYWSYLPADEQKRRRYGLC